MATIEQLSNALINADKAGDVDGARVLAGEIKRMRAAEPQQQPTGRHLTFEEGQALLDKEAQGGIGGKALAAMSGAIEGIPIAGPALSGGVMRAAAGLSSMLGGESYGTNLQQGQTILQNAQEANPMTTMGANVAGAIGSMAPLGATALGARALGIEGPSLIGRAGMSALSSGGISAADTAARGGDANEVVGSGQIGTAIGGAIPFLGAGINAGLRAAGDALYPRINAITNPVSEASRRVGTAASRDAAANPASVMNATDEATARAANIPLVNADRGGEVTRALARSAANQSPEARAAIEKTASDRFGGQSTRAVDFIKRVAGGNVDDLAVQENIRNIARASNKPAYDAAYAAPEAQALFTPRMQELMQSPTFRSAVGSVPRKSADRGAIDGFKELANPFEQNSTGAFVLRKKADGTFVAPTLQFWDHVQRNLRSTADKAFASGDKTRGAEIKALREALLNEADSSVPAFKAARQGAASFFGAEDALEAGRKFANSPRAIPEAERAVAKFSDPEKKLFQTGYASELVDKIRASGDRTNVINSVFKSQASRDSIELAMGPQKARQIEAYVRVEDLADKLRGAMGNSTTARQLVEMGIGAGGGYGMTGDWKGAVGGALAMKGARYVGERADAKVMENIAKMLTADDPMALQLAVVTASQKPAYMEALERMSDALATPARGIAVGVGNQ